MRKYFLLIPLNQRVESLIPSSLVFLSNDIGYTVSLTEHPYRNDPDLKITFVL